jgi:hypothetical protein
MNEPGSMRSSDRRIGSMRGMVAAALFLACLGTASADEQIFHPLKTEHDYSLSCPCEFGLSLGGPDEGSYGTQKMLLMIAPNEEAPFARVNLGKDDVHLTPVGRARYECKNGEVYSPQWKAGDVAVSAKLVVEGPGEESCWFAGTLSIKTAAKSETVRVKGACGC